MMWKRSIISILSLLFASISYGQLSFGDDWIADDQTYYKFYLEEEGIFRIPQSVLEDLGIPTNQVRGSQYQVYSYGQEVALQVSTDETFGSSDFITFYGQGPDGSVDGLLYRDAANQQLNPTVSLYSTKRPYFLTWTSEDEQTLRYETTSDGIEGLGLPPQEPFYMHSEMVVFDEFHHKPTHDGRNFIRFSSMDESEGFGSTLETNRTVSIPVDNLAPFGIDPRIVVRMGTNVLSNAWSITSDQRNLKTVSQKGYGVVDIEERFPLEDLTEGEFNLHIDAIGDNKQKHTLAYVELQYPREYSFDGETQIQWTQQASIISRYIEMTGFGGKSPRIYNLTTNTFLTPKIQGDVISFVTPAAFQEQDWILVDNEEAITDIILFEEVDLSRLSTSSDYLIISHQDLINSGAIDAYASYRASQEGGSYQTSIVDIGELTERYAFGIEGHPLAIKNYMAQLRADESLPDFIFLIGKGREYTEIKEQRDIRSLVPTFGIPGSDNLLLAFGDKVHPQKPVGRLAAETPGEVMNYLAKVQRHENRGEEEQTIDAQAWKKSVIHLSGGSSTNQATLFRFLNDMGGVIEANQFGANVTTFRKLSADPLERVTSEEIVDRIDNGAALMTFFGHSAVGTFDFSLEDPSVYQNEGRNPVILSLGCHSGNIHTSTGGISEDFVLEPEGGAIAFIASSGTAYPEPQYFTGINFYDLIGGDKLGQPIGEVLQNSLEMRTDNPSVAIQTLIEQLTLHGDPAYRLGTFSGPDYMIDPTSTSVSPSIIDVNTLQYTTSFDVVNLGLATPGDLIDISIIHQLPSGANADTIWMTIPAPAYDTTLTLQLNNPGIDWVGANTLLIEVDPMDQISESPAKAESNNILIDANGSEGLSFFVFDNSAKAVSPTDFGIHNDEIITLRAAVNNGLRPAGNFIIQIDTTELFDSPIFAETSVEATQSTLEWQPDIIHEVGRVYYWRVLQNRQGPGLAQTGEVPTRSFVYDPESRPGWHQSHYYQWLKNDQIKMVLDEEDRSWSFDSRIWDIRIKNEIRIEGDFWVYVNNTPWASLNPNGLGSLVSIFAWDPVDGIFTNSGTDYGSEAFTSDGFLYNMDDASDIEGIMSLLDAIPDGARVFFHTMIESDTASLNIPMWEQALVSGESLIDRLISQGATKVQDLPQRGTVPYTFIFDKGEGAVVEDIANNIQETIDLTSRAKSLWSDGTITSPLIAAAGRYLRLMWDEKKEDADQTNLYVLGVRDGGLRDTLKWVHEDYDVNLTSIDPGKYPHIELVYEVVDDVDKTAAQLDFWRVISSSLPDAAIYTEQGDFQLVDSVFAGQDLQLQFNLINETEVDMNPVLIRYTLIDENFQEKIIVKRSSGLPAGAITLVDEEVNTDQLSGKYQVVIEVNPDEAEEELSMCNNLGFTEVFVIPDDTRPTLDVTFDGRYIADREIISEHSQITVKLRDEASFLLLDDPADLDIRITYPNLFEWKADPSSEMTQWIPASDLDDNEAAYTLTPTLDQVGVYQLTIRAKDISGNIAEDSDPFEISFIIIDEDEPSILFVSPNPMTTEAVFEYVIDTDRLPTIFALNIYASDGRLMRSISAEDFGGLQSGRNTYSWDGTSAQGAIVPQGMYYYEIVDNLVSKPNRQVGGIIKME